MVVPLLIRADPHNLDLLEMEMKTKGDESFPFRFFILICFIAHLKV